jgi:hypothetical protein
MTISNEADLTGIEDKTSSKVKIQNALDTYYKSALKKIVDSDNTELDDLYKKTSDDTNIIIDSVNDGIITNVNGMEIDEDTLLIKDMILKSKEELNTKGVLSITSGKFKEDEIISVELEDEDEFNVNNVLYEWKISSRKDGTYFKIPNANNSSFRFTQKQVGKFVKIVANYTDALGVKEVVEIISSNPVENIDDIGLLGDIRGTISQGNKIKAGIVKDEDGIENIRYQWFKSEDRDAEEYQAVNDSDSDTLQLTQDDVGKYIKVTVTYTDKISQARISLESNPTSSTVTNVNDKGQVDNITGTVIENSTIKIGNITDFDGLDNVTFRYQWEVSKFQDKLFKNISQNSTSDSLTLTQKEVGQYVRIKVRYIDTAGTAEQIYSKIVGPVFNTNDLGTIGSITGTTKQGKALKAGTITDEDGLTTVSYQWQSSLIKDGQFSNIGQISRSSRFTLTQNEVGKYIRVVATYTDGGNTHESITSNTTLNKVVNINDKGKITKISGIAKEGEVIESGNISDADGYNQDATYQWLVFDSTQGRYINIDGATSNAYTITQNEVGKYIKLKVIYTDELGYVETIYSAKTSLIANKEVLGTVVISDTNLSEDATLTATVTDEDGFNENKVKYQWMSSSNSDGPYTNIQNNAKSKTLVLTQNEVGKFVKVRAIYRDNQNTSTSISAITNERIENTSDIGEVKIIGQLIQEDETLTANLIDEDGFDETEIIYTWLQSSDNNNYETIPNSNSKVFRLTQAQVGKYIKAKAIYSDNFNSDKNAISRAVGRIGNVKDVGIINVTGIFKQDQNITANITDEDGFIENDVRYQWSMSDSQNSGFEDILTHANGKTFKLTASVVNKYLKVEAKYVDNGAVNEILIFKTKKIANINDALSIGTIQGTAKENETLSISFIDLDGYDKDKVKYQWMQSIDKKSFSSIDNATSRILKLTQDHVGRYIKVKISYTDKYGTKESATSQETTSQVVNIDELGIATINTNIIHKEGATLETTFYDKDGVNGGTTYQWQSSLIKDAGSFPDISDAESTTFVLTQKEVAKYVRCKITYIDATSKAEKIIYSPVSNKIQNVNQPGTILDITGTEKEDENLTAGNIVTDPDNVTNTNINGKIDNNKITYQWQSSSSKNSGFVNIQNNANAKIFTLTQNEVAKYVRVVATYTDKYNIVEKVASKPTIIIANINKKGIITFTGTVSEGYALIANVSDEDGHNPNRVSYQWQIDDDKLGAFTDIPDGTNKRYTVGGLAIRKYIRVKATYTDDYGFPETIHSEPSSQKVTHRNSPATIVIDGRFAEDENLTINITDADGYDNNITYSWFMSRQSSSNINDYTQIADQNGSVLTLTQNEVGYYIKAKAYYVDLNGTEEDLISANINKVANEEDIGTIDLNDTNAIQYGTLVASDVVDEDGVSGQVLYQWIRIGDNNTPIAGATTLSYILTQEDVNHTIKIRAIYKDAISGVSKTIDSNDSAIIQNVDDNGTITISGTLMEDSNITAGTIIDLDGVDNSKPIVYSWIITDPSGTNTTVNGKDYALEQKDVGKILNIEATYTDKFKSRKKIKSDNNITVQNNDSLGILADITGNIKELETITAGNVTDIDGVQNSTYQWEVSDNNITFAPIINDSTNKTFILSESEVGKYIRVKVTYTDNYDFNTTLTSNHTKKTRNVNNIGIVTIDGTVKQNETLTANINDTDGKDTGGINGVLYTNVYQWAADDINITNATLKTFVPTQAYVGKQLTVRVKYRDGHYSIATIDSNKTTPVINVNDTGTVVIQGNNKIGEENTIIITDADGYTNATNKTNTKYEWSYCVRADYDNGECNTFTNSNSEKFIVTDDSYEGYYLYVNVDYSDDFNDTNNIDSPFVKILPRNNPGKLEIISNPRPEVGDVLDSNITDTDGINNLNYTWKISDTINGNFTSIADSNHSQFTLTEAQVGKYMKISATYVDNVNIAETLESNATAQIKVNNIVGMITIVGNFDQNETLDANVTDDNNITNNITYQWKSCDTNNGDFNDISDANSSRFTLTQAQVGKYIQVYATYIDDGDFTETIQSNVSVQRVTNVNDIGVITIEGNATINHELTVIVTDEDGIDLGARKLYWFADGVKIADTNISTTKYMLTEKEARKIITVQAKYIDELNTLEDINASTALVIDDINPTVQFFTPADDNNTVDGTSIYLGIIFSEDINVSNDITKKMKIRLNDSVSTIYSTRFADDTNITMENNITFIRLDDHLKYGEQYYVEIDNGLFEDLSGNIYEGIQDTTTWNFDVPSGSGGCGCDQLDNCDIDQALQ